MEYIDGCAVDDKERLKEEGYDLKEIGSKLVDNYIKQVMDDGFFSCRSSFGKCKDTRRQDRMDRYGNDGAAYGA